MSVLVLVDNVRVTMALVIVDVVTSSVAFVVWLIRVVSVRVESSRFDDEVKWSVVVFVICGINGDVISEVVISVVGVMSVIR